MEATNFPETFPTYRSSAYNILTEGFSLWDLTNLRFGRRRKISDHDKQDGETTTPRQHFSVVLQQRFELRSSIHSHS